MEQLQQQYNNMFPMMQQQQQQPQQFLKGRPVSSLEALIKVPQCLLTVDVDVRLVFDGLRDFPLMRDEFVRAVNNRSYSFN